MVIDSHFVDKEADQLVVHGAVHVDAAVRRAFLAAESERGAHDPLARDLEVGARHDDGRVLAAHLDDAGAGVRVQERAMEGHPDLVRAGEDDAVDRVAACQLVADGVAGSHHEVDDPVGKARVAEGLHQRDRAHRPGARGLEDDRVAGHQRRGRRTARERHGEVEGADDGEDAVRPQDRAGPDGGVAERVERPIEVRLALGRVRVVADEVGALLDLAERLDAVLADLDGHQAGVLHLALADQLRGAAQEREALGPAERSPGRLRGARRGDRVADVLARGRRETADEDVGVDGRAQLEGRVARALAAADDVRVVLTEASAGTFQAALESGMQSLVVRAERRVGDLDALAACGIAHRGRSSVSRGRPVRGGAWSRSGGSL